MTIKYDTRACTITTNWEWGQNGGSGATKTVTVTGVSVNCKQEYAWDGAYWNPLGSPTRTDGDTYNYSDSEGYTNPSLPFSSWDGGSTEAPTYSGTTIDQRVWQYGSGTATYSGTVTQTSSNSWGAVSTTNSASPSISYDDGIYAGTLYLDSVSGSPSPPSYNGSYIGDTAVTSTSGTANYSGDVPLKGSGGGTGSRPSNWSWTTLSPTATTYTFGKLKVNLLTATEWNNFCTRVNEFRTYKGLPTIAFTSATSSGDFTQAMYDTVYNAINAMSSVSSAVGFYTKLVNLSTALNNIG